MRNIILGGCAAVLLAACAVLLAACAVLLAACAGAPPQAAAPVDQAQLQDEVRRTERAFAKTMADRDAQAFAGFLGEEAIFFNGAHSTLRGKAAIAAAWLPYFAKPAAPFSWDPDEVEVLDSGTLALSTGPVYDAQGKRIATFNSIWRREAPGVWHIVFDKGSGLCE